MPLNSIKAEFMIATPRVLRDAVGKSNAAACSNSHRIATGADKNVRARAPVVVVLEKSKMRARAGDA